MCPHVIQARCDLLSSAAVAWQSLPALIMAVYLIWTGPHFLEVCEALEVFTTKLNVFRPNAMIHLTHDAVQGWINCVTSETCHTLQAGKSYS